ncbi:protein SRC2 [Artemisia annua]|uniref:Protein SRC2 n=1 Tax=Artemisia annua TaxID=35608 RepID=A0A2U1NZP3_ARTAN|nr:protein SRC2 [Artemisia annua]
MANHSIEGNILELTVVGCKNLKDIEGHSTLNPYICVHYESRTSVCKGPQVQLANVLSRGYDDSPWPLKTQTDSYAGEVRLIMHYSHANNSASSSAPSALSYDASSAYYNAMYSAPPAAPYMLYRPLAPILLYPPPAPILLYLPPAPIMVQLANVLSRGYDDSPWPLKTQTDSYAGEVRLIMHYSHANASTIHNSASSSAPSALSYDASSAYYNAMYSAPPAAPYMLYRPLAPILLYPPPAPILLYPPPAPILLYLPPAPIMLHPPSPYPPQAAPNSPLPHGSHCPYGNS